MIKLDGIRLHPGESEEELYKIAERALGAKPQYFRILKKSVDARRKDSVALVYSIECSSSHEAAPVKKLPMVKNQVTVYVVGAGPAGLAAAVRLVDCGIKPVIIERGETVERRNASVERFFETGELDENSNVQFGEGGAGTFSDGKLNTQTHTGYVKEVLDMFVRFGAPEEVAYLAKPHVGSDKLTGVLGNIRKHVESNGGEFLFGRLFTGFSVRDGKLFGIRYSDVKTGFTVEKEASRVILAIGHSSRDTFKMLISSGIAAERRDFAVGLRIEHVQERISASQYGSCWRNLPPADYKLVSRVGERPVFTFCNCPGGYVMAASSEKGGITTNGMSRYARDGVNCNSALLVNVLDKDLQSGGFMAGVDFQRNIERRAFELTGRTYKAPAISVGALLGKSDSSVKVSPTYPLGVLKIHPEEYLPDFIVNSIKAAIPDFGKKLHGFDSAGALLTGPETRFTSPLRFIRNDSFESVSCAGLYPCGEGGGYSGGITTSAADGLRIADRIVSELVQM